MYSIILYGISYIFLMAFFFLFLPHRYSSGKTIVICSLSVLLLIISDLFKIKIFSGNNLSYVIMTLIEIVLVQGTALFISAARNSKALFTGLCGSNYIIAGNVAGSIIIIITGDIIAAAVISICIHFLILFLLASKVRRIYLNFFQQNMQEWWRLCVIPTLFYCTFCFLAFFPHNLYENPNNIPAVVMLILTMFVFYMVIFKYIENEKKASEIFWQNITFQTYINGLETQYAAVEKAEDNLKILRHDMRHYIQIANSMIDQKKYEELKQLFQNITEVIDKSKIIKYCENSQINSVISNFVERGKAHDITVETDIKMSFSFETSKNGSISNMELASVIANLLENAVQSTEKLKKKEKFVHLFIRYMEERLIIEVKNECENEIYFNPLTGLPVSTKGEGHGMGLKSVAAFAEKTGANFDCYCQDGIFTVRVLANF